MKLLNKTGIYYFVLSFIVMVLGASLFYKLLVKYVDSSSTGELLVQQQKIIQELALLDSVPINNYTPNKSVQFYKKERNDSLADKLADVMLAEPGAEERVPYRVLSFDSRTRLYNYRVTLSQSQVAGDALVAVIIKSVGLMVVLLFILLFIINQAISKQIWKPFYHTLQQLRLFDVQRSSRLTTLPASVSEFKELNYALEQMTIKIQSDYRNLKEFTENASHEIQTPLAIVRSKIELLLQGENLTEMQWKQLGEINEAVDRLSRLSHSLLLLSKIENGQFNQTEKVNLSKAIEHYATNLSELMVAKNIRLIKDIEAGIYLSIHPHLLDILLSNLWMNAIRHNMDGGFIDVKLRSGLLLLKNSGQPLTVPAEELFNRFKKGNSETSSTGIGLSIVQKIATSNQIKISYTCRQQMHIIELFF